MHDLDGVSFHGMHDDVGQGRKRQFPGTAAMAGSADVRHFLQRAGAVVNRSDGVFGKLRVVLVQIILDVL